jgi:hypothetical protein
MFWLLLSASALQYNKQSLSSSYSHTTILRIDCGDKAVRETGPLDGGAVVVGGAHQTVVQSSRDAFFAAHSIEQTLDKDLMPSAAVSGVGLSCRVRGSTPSNSILSASALLSAIGYPPQWTCTLRLQLL